MVAFRFLFKTNPKGYELQKRLPLPSQRVNRTDSKRKGGDSFASGALTGETVVLAADLKSAEETQAISVIYQVCLVRN